MTFYMVVEMDDDGNFYGAPNMYDTRKDAEEDKERYPCSNGGVLRVFECKMVSD